MVDGWQAWQNDPTKNALVNGSLPRYGYLAPYSIGYLPFPLFDSRFTMAEDEIATKAPESDVQGSLVPGDTPAQEGASMGVGIQNALDLETFANSAY